MDSDDDNENDNDDDCDDGGGDDNNWDDGDGAEAEVVHQEQDFPDAIVPDEQENVMDEDVSVVCIAHEATGSRAESEAHSDNEASTHISENVL